MKKTSFVMAVLLASLILTMPKTANAEGGRPVYDPAHYASAADRVTDRAGIWSDRAEEELRNTAYGLAEKYQTDIVLLSVVVPHDPALGDGSYGSITEFADDYYDHYGFGFGSGRDGMILVISMEPGNRQYHFSTAGREYESYSSSDIRYVKESLEALLTGGDYEGAARRFLELAAEHEENGRFDPSARARSMDPNDLLWAFALALIVAWAITSNMKRRMNPVVKATRAQNYIVNGSYELRGYNEIYLGSTVTRRPRQQNRNSGGFGGGHIGSSGTGHGGGGGHF